MIDDYLLGAQRLAQQQADLQDTEDKLLDLLSSNHGAYGDIHDDVWKKIEDLREATHTAMDNIQNSNMSDADKFQQRSEVMDKAFQQLKKITDDAGLTASDFGKAIENLRPKPPERMNGIPLNQKLADARQRLAQELQEHPGLREKFLDIMYNEQGRNPLGTLGIAESAMNRALLRGTTLSQELRWHESEGGYYQQGNMGRGSGPYRDFLGRQLNTALAGSNVTNYATDNSSGDLARREIASGRFNFRASYGGETFSSPGSAERRLQYLWGSYFGRLQYS